MPATHRVTAAAGMLTDVVPAPLAWKATDLSVEDWSVALSPESIAEIGEMAKRFGTSPGPYLLRTASAEDAPHLAQCMVEVRDRLDTGCGFCVIDGLPMDQYPVPDLVACFWVIGQWLGRPVAQTWQGDMLYEVTDTGEAYRYGVRGSRTRVELFFHTDNAFGRSPPHYVGLFCRQPALEGGISRFCSLYTLHNRLLERYPELLARLYQPLLFDRQGEHAEGAAPTAEMPFFAYDGKRLQARVNVSLVRKGYDVAGRDIPKELDDALDAVQEVLSAADMWVEAPLQRGQLQYLNNLDIGHYRSGFTDSASPQLRRHLYRTWHRDVGQQTYDG